MKKLLLVPLLILAALPLLAPLSVQAKSFDELGQEQCSTPGARHSSACEVVLNGNGDNPLVGPDGLLTKVINIIALLTGIASVIVIIISGIMYITAAGDTAKVSNARQTLTYAVIGVIVTLLAAFIVRFFLSRVGG